MRLETYAANVNAVVGYYKDVLAEIDGNRDMSVVFNDCAAAIDAKGK